MTDFRWLIEAPGPGIGWFYMRRPGDFDDDAPIATDESQSAAATKS